MALGIPLRSCGDDSLPLRRALVAGLFPHAARRQMDGGWTGWGGGGGGWVGRRASFTSLHNFNVHGARKGLMGLNQTVF